MRIQVIQSSCRMFASEITNVVYSDEEDENPMDTDVRGSDNWENFTLRFGKYKGTNLAEMIKKGRTRGYLRYIMTWQDIRPHTAANIEKALQVYNASKDARDLSIPEPLLPVTRTASEAFSSTPLPLTRTDTYDDGQSWETQRPRFQTTRKK